MSDQKKISTVNAFLDAMGGTKEVADWCGISQANISQWRARDKIPALWHYRLYLEAKRRGLDCDFPSVFWNSLRDRWGPLAEIAAA